MKLTFFKNDQCYANIEDYLELDPKFYQHIPITDSSKKVILPGTYLEVLSTRLKEKDTNEVIDNVQQQLSVLKLKVEGRHIYNNKIMTERDLHWFIRHHVA